MLLMLRNTEGYSSQPEACNMVNISLNLFK